MLAVNVVYELVCDLFAGFVFKNDSLYAEVLWFGGILAGIMFGFAGFDALKHINTWFAALEYWILMYNSVCALEYWFAALE